VSTKPQTPRTVRIATAVFRGLILQMPGRYRARHGDDVVGLMVQLATDAYARSATRGVLGVFIAATLDLVARIPAEYKGGLSHTRGQDRPSAGARLRTTVDTLRRDLRYGGRSLRRHPFSSAAAIATLAIGIGVNAAVFSVADWVLFRPLPYPSPQEVVRVFTAGAAPITSPADLTYSEFLTCSRATTFRASAAWSTATRVMGGLGLEPIHVVIARVGGDLFATLGTYPEIGRGFTMDEANSGAPVVVVSHALWRSRFSGDPAFVGRTITIDGRQQTVIGVMPPGPSYPNADLWRPLTAGEREDDDRELTMIGRLRAGTSPERANVELAPLARGTTESPRTAWVEDLQRTAVHDVRPALRALLASAALILLMACANVAALLGARGTERAGEMAVRGALGATRGTLVRQLLTESLVLAVVGGSLGLLLGQWTLSVLVQRAPPGLPRLAEITLDGRVVAAGFCATLIVGLVVGLASSFRASRVNLRASLGGAAPSRASRRTEGRRVLVAAQISIAIVLTVGAGLLAQSLQHLVTIDHGFSPNRLLTVDLYLRGVSDVRQLFDQFVEAAEAVPGVRSAAAAGQPPTQIPGLRVPVRLEGLPSTAAIVSTLRPVTARYFETAGISLSAGRSFTARDRRTAPRVAIVNATFVRDVLRGRSAVGARLTTDLIEGPVTIVGVAADVTPSGQVDRPALYLPIDQIGIGGGVLLVRTDGNPRSVVPALTTRIRAIAPTLALDRIQAVADTLAAGRADARFTTELVSGFAGLALLLSAIGVYGLTADEAVARSRELAVRIALGATRGEALWTVMRPGAAALVAGAVVGFALSIGAGRWMTALLHGIQPSDPATLLVAPVLLAVVGLVAASLAAAKVLRTDPAESLRRE
jgi:putative ABC transport system permease protein